MQPVLMHVLFYIPLLVVAVKLGNYLHEKVKEEHFRVAIYSLLLMTGVILVISRYLK
jgi:uncharacterized membrane protein YfcA